MTTITRAIASGNYSNTATWLNGVLPQPGMLVAANGFTITIDQNISIGGQYCPQVTAGNLVTGMYYMIEEVRSTNWTAAGAAFNLAGTVFQATGPGTTATNPGLARAIGTLTTAAATGAVAGGGFVVSSGSPVIAADIRSGTTQCLSLSGTASATLDGSGTFQGSPIRLRFVPSATAGAHGIGHGSTGILTLSQCAGSQGSGTGVHALNNSGGGSIAINGGVHATTQNAASSVFNLANGTFTADGATFNASGTSANTAAVLVIGASGSAVVNNCTLLGGGSASNAIQVAGGSLAGSGNTVNGGYAIIFSGTPSVNLSGNTYVANSLGPAIYSILTTAILKISGTELDHSGSGFAAVIALRRSYGDVAASGAYRQGALSTGAAYIQADAGYASFGLPNASDVLEGVIYAGGQRTGTARTTSPTVAAIQSGIRAELSPELALITTNLNATIASRLASNSYTAPPTADAISTAVQQGILNENDGQAILNAIVGAIGNQNIDQIALVAAIRADLERSGGVLVTRLAAQNYTAPDNTGITAIKAVTDLLSTSRLSNVPTEDFLLQVISQWLSSSS